MKNFIILVLFQALSSTISGILVSKMSFFGRLGISFFYKEYTVFKVWWQSALLFFAVQLVLIFILFLIHRIGNRKIGQIFAGLMMLACIVGCFFTYHDFTQTSHKIMKSYFHFGFYLFWASAMFSCGCAIFTQKAKPSLPEPHETQELQEENEEEAPSLQEESTVLSD